MTCTSLRTSTVDPVLAEMIEDANRKLEAGEPVDPGNYAAEHPEQAEQLRRLLPAMEVLVQLERPEPELASLGDYRIIREIGRGGMGIVYEAEQISLRRRVALKVLPFIGTLDARRLQRFQNEALAAACLHHTNIVPVFGVGCERAIHFYAMQYIEGQSLAAILHELQCDAGLAAGREELSRPLPPPNSLRTGPSPSNATIEETARRAVLSTKASMQDVAYFRSVAELGIQSAEALAHAHESGIIHRDIKPANLLLDGHGKLWITDFGLAHMVSAGGSGALTMSGELLGTLRYMSPEQALGKHHTCDHRTDIYSLSATLYEMLTLHPAISGQNRQEILQKIAALDPPPLRQQNRAVPADLETIVLKGLEKNPADRYGTAREMADDLRRWLDHRSILARRPTLVQRASKAARRHREVVWTAAVLALLSLAGLVVALILIAGARAEALHQRDEARAQAVQTRRLLYAADLKLARQCWKHVDVLNMRNRLAAYIPQPGEEDLRTFEWRLLWRACHAELLTLEGHTGDVYHVAYSPDGRFIASASQDHSVKLWDACTGATVRTYREHEGDVTWVSFSPDGKELVSGSTDRTARLWDVASGRYLATLAGHARELVVAEFSPDGRFIATGASYGDDASLRIWDRATNQVCAIANAGRIESVAFAPSGEILVSGGSDGIARVWDISSVSKAQETRVQQLKPLRTFQVPSQTGVCGVAISRDAQTLAMGCYSGDVLTQDLLGGGHRVELSERLQNPLGRPVQAVACSDDGKFLATGSNDGGIRIFELATGRADLLIGHTDRVWGLAFSHDGARLASASRDGTIRTWDFAAKPSKQLLEPAPGLQSIAFSTDSKRLIGINKAGIARLWAVDGWVLERSLVPPSGTQGSKAPVGPDGSAGSPVPNAVRDGVISCCAPTGAEFSMATTGLSVDVRWYDAATGREIARSSPAGHDSVRCLAYSPDGQVLAAGTANGRLTLWDNTTRKVMATIPAHSRAVRSVAFSSDARTIATGGDDGTLRLWNMATQQDPLVLEEFPSPVSSVAFSPDGLHLAASVEMEKCSEVYVWSLGEDSR